MKKKIFGGIAIFAIAAVAALNMNMNMNSKKSIMSALCLNNIEALAQSEGLTGWGCENDPSVSCLTIVITPGGGYGGYTLGRN